MYVHIHTNTSLDVKHRPVQYTNTKKTYNAIKIIYLRESNVVRHLTVSKKG